MAWRSKKETTALAFLEIQEKVHPAADVARTQLQRRVWNEELTRRGTALYTALNCTKAAVIGHVSSTAELLCSSIVDLFFWGDVRDLGVQGFKAATGQDTDIVIAALAAIGLAIDATTIPTGGSPTLPANAGIALLKGCPKTRCSTLD